MDVNRLKLLIVAAVAMLSLALSASGTLAHHDRGHGGPRGNDTPAFYNCALVYSEQSRFFDPESNRNPKGPKNNCDHI